MVTWYSIFTSCSLLRVSGRLLGLGEAGLSVFAPKSLLPAPRRQIVLGEQCRYPSRAEIVATISLPRFQARYFDLTERAIKLARQIQQQILLRGSQGPLTRAVSRLRP